MCQIENEYGSFGNDKQYLKAIKRLMEKHGCDVPMFTSDGGWREVLDAGTLLNEGVLPTANFGSRTDEQIGALRQFMNDNDIHGPLMCMEFWIGWFNNWGSPLKTRDAKEAADELDAMLRQGSVNIYMFHGGTNPEFYNGCSYHNGMDPQITSYDYAAPLTEWGTEAEKYAAFREVIAKYNPITRCRCPRRSPLKAMANCAVKTKFLYLIRFPPWHSQSKPTFLNRWKNWDRATATSCTARMSAKHASWPKPSWRIAMTAPRCSSTRN